MELLKKLKAAFVQTEYLRAAVPELKHMGRKVGFWLFINEWVLVAQVYPTKLLLDGFNSRQVPMLIKKWFGDISLEMYLYGVALVILLIYLVGVYLHKLKSVAQNDFEIKLKSLIWAEAHHKELTLSTDWHLAHGTGEKESIISKNASRVSLLLNSLIWHAGLVMLRILVTTVAVFMFGWEYGVLGIATLILYVVIVRYSVPYVKPMIVEYHEDEKRLDIFGSELTASWRPIRSFGLEPWFSRRNYDLLMECWQRERVRHAKWRKYVDQPDYMLAFSRYCMVVIGIVQWAADSSKVGSIVLCWMLLERVYSNYYRLGEFQRQLQIGLEALEELLGVILTVPTVRQSANPQWPAEVKGAVEFRNVRMTYDTKRQLGVRGVNLVVQSNEIIAFIGKTGCGKTTMLALLQREFDPQEGSIVIDGIDLRDLDYDRFRREMIAVVQQRSVLFNDTIARNISVARRFEATDEEIREAARMALVDEFVADLPNGYNTLIGENGILLSGGQQQRLAIARALLRKPKILILDEPTSALDPDSQHEVQKAIDSLVRSRSATIFVVAHRHSTYMSADRVVVMKRGKIEMVGTHEELARKNGTYRRFRDLETNGALA